MRKLFYLGLIALAGIIIGLAWAEQITLTTYYPAPYGVYREFTTTGNTYLATNEGNVGIGTTQPNTDYPQHALPWSAEGVKLDIDTSQSTFEGLRIRGDNNYPRIRINDRNTHIAFLVDPDGNVGIGVAEPKTALDVNGLIKTAQYSWSTKPDALTDNKGAIFYNTDDDKMYYSNGSNWQPMGGGGTFGVWNDRDGDGVADTFSTGQVYTAQTAGIVIAFIERVTLWHITGYTPSSTKVAEDYAHGGTSGSITFPVKRGDTWRVEQVNPGEGVRIFWLPLGD